jgi:hypothetical protein
MLTEELWIWAPLQLGLRSLILSVFIDEAQDARREDDRFDAQKIVDSKDSDGVLLLDDGYVSTAVQAFRRERSDKRTANRYARVSAAASSSAS